MYCNSTVVREISYQSEVDCLIAKQDSLYEVIDTMTDTIESSIVIAPRKNGKIRSGFGMRWHPVLNRFKPHQGVDIISDNDTVFAAHAGVVVRDTFSNSYGNVIKIKNDNIQSLYAHLKLSFNKDTVSAGEPIGIRGSTGLSTGNHLHFELRDTNDIVINPVRYKMYDLSSNKSSKNKPKNLQP